MEYQIANNHIASSEFLLDSKYLKNHNESEGTLNQSEDSKYLHEFPTAHFELNSSSLSHPAIRKIEILDCTSH
jgi:hypothetical protein